MQLSSESSWGVVSDMTETALGYMFNETHTASIKTKDLSRWSKFPEAASIFLTEQFPDSMMVPH
jgi:hypothetical protein